MMGISLLIVFGHLKFDFSSELAITVIHKLWLTLITPTAWERQATFVDENENSKYNHFLVINQEKE